MATEMGAKCPVWISLLREWLFQHNVLLGLHGFRTSPTAAVITEIDIPLLFQTSAAIFMDFSGQFRNLNLLHVRSEPASQIQARVEPNLVKNQTWSPKTVQIPSITFSGNFV